MRELLFVGAGGAFGAMGRFLLSRTVNRAGRWLLPVGTISVNLIGAFLLGLLLEVASERMVSPELRGLLAIGFLGSFTTFSTFSLETLNLIREYQCGAAAVNVLGSVVLGLASALLGITVARLLLR
jgi:CrcB protein